MLNADESVLRAARADQLIKFGLDRRTVAVLSALDQKHHEERHDRRSGIDHELPGVRVAEHRNEKFPLQLHIDECGRHKNTRTLRGEAAFIGRPERTSRTQHSPSYPREMVDIGLLNQGI
jgi:hypothetical protein